MKRRRNKSLYIDDRDCPQFLKRKVKVMENDPNVAAAVEASQKFIKEHPKVPIVDVPPVVNRPAGGEQEEEKND